MQRGHTLLLSMVSIVFGLRADCFERLIVDAFVGAERLSESVEASSVGCVCVCANLNSW